jgi:hypothetical protein
MFDVWVWPSKIKKSKKNLKYCVLFEKLVFTTIQWHYIIILEEDRNLNFVSDDILPDVVARSGSHENYSTCRMDFVSDGIVNSLME